jgi:hypothetical protein
MGVSELKAKVGMAGIRVVTYIQHEGGMVFLGAALHNPSKRV